MAQNDPIYKAGDQVKVYQSGQVAALAGVGVLANDGAPRLARVVREHPSEPGTLEIAYDDDGTGELITDQQRLRPAAAVMDSGQGQ